ncbi:MAG: DNA primase [Acidobacteriota bacterium]
MFTEEVKSQADIVRIVSDYLTLKKRGKNYLANCPFHTEKTPSFNVNPAMQIFHCFGCSVGGDVFGFIMQIERCDFVQAVKLVAEKVGIAVPKFDPGADAQRLSEEREELLELNTWALEFFQEQLQIGTESERARAYLAQRGISEQICKELRLGYAPDRWDALSSYLRTRGASPGLIERSGLVSIKENGAGHYDRFRGRCMFPISDAQGRVIAFGGRILAEGEPKYLNSSETSLYSKGRNLYGLCYAKEAIRKQRFAILVEGYLDFIIPYQEGVQNIVASLGTALTEHQVRLLSRYMDQPQIVVNFDPDAAGVAATKRSLEMLLEQGYKVNVLTLPDGEDPDTFIRKHGASMYRQLLKKSQPYLEYILTQSLREHDITRPAGKVETLNAILPFLAKVRDRVERAEYAELVADRLKLEGRVVREELKRAAIGKRQQLDPAKLSDATRVLPAERELLEMLLACPTLRQAILSQIESELLVGLVSEPIFAAIQRLTDAGSEIDFTNLRENIAQNGQIDHCESILTGLMISSAEVDTFEETKLRRAAESRIIDLRRTYLNKQQHLLQLQINQAQRDGDNTRSTELMREKIELSNKLKKYFDTSTVKEASH